MSNNKQTSDDFSIEERKAMRFASDQNNLASIDLNIDANCFSPSINALVVDESHQGCSLVTLENNKLQKGDTVTLAVGRLTPLKASIEWRQQLTPKIILLGCKYLE